MEENALDSLGYVLVQICKAHHRKADELLQSRTGLYAGQEVLLMQLWEKNGCIQAELADNLCIQPATLTRSLDRLEKSGFLERRNDPDDRRVFRIYLTEAGWALRDPIQAVWQELDAALKTGLREEEAMLLRRLLQQLLQNLG